MLSYSYTQQDYSILQEERIGLLGHAALLGESDVSRFVSTFRQRHPNVYGMRDFVNWSSVRRRQERRTRVKIDL